MGASAFLFLGYSGKPSLHAPILSSHLTRGHKETDRMSQDQSSVTERRRSGEDEIEDSVKEVKREKTIGDRQRSPEPTRDRDA
jgi:hypothetical protein